MSLTILLIISAIATICTLTAQNKRPRASASRRAVVITACAADAASAEAAEKANALCELGISLNRQGDLFMQRAKNARAQAAQLRRSINAQLTGFLDDKTNAKIEKLELSAAAFETRARRAYVQAQAQFMQAEKIDKKNRGANL